MLFFKSSHPARRVKSFEYAFQGLFHALINEPNFRAQIAIAVFTFVLGSIYKISNTEWGLLTLSIGALLAAEMLNTVVEELIDVLIKEYHEGAKIIKDLAAGFVLTTALTTLIIMYLIFFDRIAGAL